MGFSGSRSKDDKENVKTISEKVQADAEQSLKRPKKSKKLNLKKLILILTLGYVSFTSYSCYSLLAPFLPREAEHRGLTPTQYGIIFASYEFVRLVMSPVCSIIVSITSFVFF